MTPWCDAECRRKSEPRVMLDSLSCTAFRASRSTTSQRRLARRLHTTWPCMSKDRLCQQYKSSARRLGWCTRRERCRQPCRGPTSSNQASRYTPPDRFPLHPMCLQFHPCPNPPRRPYRPRPSPMNLRRPRRWLRLFHPAPCSLRCPRYYRWRWCCRPPCCPSWCCSTSNPSNRWFRWSAFPSSFPPDHRHRPYRCPRWPPIRPRQRCRQVPRPERKIPLLRRRPTRRSRHRRSGASLGLCR